MTTSIRISIRSRFEFTTRIRGLIFIRRHSRSVVNTGIEDFKFVNRLAKVLETPKAFSTGIKTGDTIVIHQNVFRTFYDMKGNKKKSRSWFKDNLYFCAADQIYLYKNKTGWHSFNDRCFITPIKYKLSLNQDLLFFLLPLMS